jgi:hypothetical protein
MTNTLLPTLDHERFLHAWQLACAAADGDVQTLDGIAGRQISLIDGDEVVDLQVADRPETRFLDAVTSVFRADGMPACWSATARLIELFQLLGTNQVPDWVAEHEGVPVVHEALIRGAARATLREGEGFDLADLEARATEMEQQFYGDDS